MDEMEELKDNLNNSKVKLKELQNLIDTAMKGDSGSADNLIEMLNKEEDPDVWVKPFEIPLKSLDDKRVKFIYKIDLLKILENKNLSESHKKSIIDFAKSAIKICEADDFVLVTNAIKILLFLADKDDLSSFVSEWLKKDSTKVWKLLATLKDNSQILQMIIDKMGKEPDEYRKKINDFYFWLIEKCQADALKIFYEIFSDYIFEPPKLSALQMVAEKIKFSLKENVSMIKTIEPSPIFKKSKKIRQFDESKKKEFIPVDELLGVYLPDEKTIKLYEKEICACAMELGVLELHLTKIVELHEAAHAIVHLGEDEKGGKFNTEAYKSVDKGQKPSPLHETLAELLTYHCIKENYDLIECFEKLDKVSPEEYQNWKIFKDVPLEQIKDVLIKIRNGEIEATFDSFAKNVLDGQNL